MGRLGIGTAMLPALTDILDLTLDELLVGQPSMRVSSKRGPVSRLAQQFDAVTNLPKNEQRFVMQMLDTVLAQPTG